MRVPRGAVQLPSLGREQVLGQRGACKQQSQKTCRQQHPWGPGQPSTPRKTPPEPNSTLLTACQALPQPQRGNSASLCPAPCHHQAAARHWVPLVLLHSTLPFVVLTLISSPPQQDSPSPQKHHSCRLPGPPCLSLARALQQPQGQQPRRFHRTASPALPNVPLQPSQCSPVLPNVARQAASRRCRPRHGPFEVRRKKKSALFGDWRCFTPNS